MMLKLEKIINYDSDKARIGRDSLPKGSNVKTSGGILFSLNDKGGDKVKRAS